MQELCKFHATLNRLFEQKRVPCEDS